MLHIGFEFYSNLSHINNWPEPILKFWSTIKLHLREVKLWPCYLLHLKFILAADLFSSDLSADIKPSQTYFILQSNSRWSRLRILGSDAGVDSSVSHMSAMSKSPKCQSWALVQDPSLWTTTPTCLYWTIKKSHITPDVHVHVQSGYGLVQLFVHLSFTIIVQIIYALTLAGACMIKFWSGEVWAENSSLLWIFQLHQLKIDP